MTLQLRQQICEMDLERLKSAHELSLCTMYVFDRKPSINTFSAPIRTLYLPSGLCVFVTEVEA